MQHGNNARAAQRPGRRLVLPVRLIPEGVGTKKNVVLADSLDSALPIDRINQCLVRTGFTDIRRNETGRAPQRWHPRQASQEDRCSSHGALEIDRVTGCLLFCREVLAG